ncbi:PIN2/TERF1-interacting telomerase inhibitor 1 isoform X2 [Hemicordylus capensis]|uniref:PIN2/TERF1-interacting telomerase inhibitor 1 isoform X2 n=1 Tax=Hemicordylus capensis TaxID=884348 RepID=UPI002304B2BA|nr:PIN2/TERF1-interacting telomerase inhibitor 1 isoform X2 [Hemicordylus capensis]
MARRKQKWSVDPRNSAWSKDESKFGQKMLEKMGWSKGKGLGAQEQGNTEHIKVHVKTNTLGLGAAVNQEDNWIAHQDDFNQLLAELNDCHGQDTPEAPSGEGERKFSLEEKSKTSRKRVHYVKFAKGKDLSSRSEDDLSCIFGKRQKTQKTQVSAANTDTREEGLEEEDDPPKQMDASNTVTSTLTVQEYFARRMAKLKKAQNGMDVKPAGSPPSLAEELECLATRPKKKKSQKHVGTENVCGGPKMKCPGTLGSREEEVDELDTQKRKKKKKKKLKYVEIGGSLNCNGSQRGAQGRGTSNGEVDDLEEPSPKIKSKKKNKNKDTAEGDEESTRRKKKKKHSS